MTKIKKEQRNEMLKKLDALPESEIALNTALITEKLVKSDSWRYSHVIGITISRNREVETREIIKKAWGEGREVAVPKCFPDENKLAFHVITSFDQLEKGYFGLWEPIVAQTRVVNKSDIDLLLVPGVCFTIDGFRIGYGGGYFDRYLVDYKQDSISLLHECQLLSKVPIEKFDIPVQQLITEKRKILCNGS